MDFLTRTPYRRNIAPINTLIAVICNIEVVYILMLWAWCQVYVLLFQGTRAELEGRLETSTTLYVGNMSFFTTEEQIYELFSKAGDVKRIIMGLDRYKKTPCGFCFVEYYFREGAENAVRYRLHCRLQKYCFGYTIDEYYHFLCFLAAESESDIRFASSRLDFAVPERCIFAFLLKSEKKILSASDL